MARKCILILVDGMRPDALPVCGHPFYQEFLSSGAVQIPARSVMPSVTLPCHISLFHSVPPERHGTTTNTYAPQVRPVHSLFEVLSRNGRSCGMCCNWEQLRDIAVPGCLAFSHFENQELYEDTDCRLTDTAIRFISEKKPDCFFLYLGETDENGHHYGWMSPEYLHAVCVAWECIRRVAFNFQEEYDIIITADHGGHERSHGTELEEDMNIPLLVRTAGGLALRSDVHSSGLLDIAPTICKLLDCPADRDWEGHSLV